MRQLFWGIELVKLLARGARIHFGPRLRVAKHQETQYARQWVSDECQNIRGAYDYTGSAHNAPIFS
jgi:hypothetical protein